MTAARDDAGVSSEEYFGQLRQGSLVLCSGRDDLGAGFFGANCSYAAIVSQTCDVVLAKRPTIILAPVVELADGEAQSARRRDNPRFIHLPRLGDHYFVDLAHVNSVSKADIVHTATDVGLDTDDDTAVRDFALAVGRWFSRFAFPNEIVPWLKPLLDVVKARYRREHSALGQVLRDVVEIRIESEQWAARPLGLILHVIARAGSIPTVDDASIGMVPDGAFDANKKILSPSGLADLIVSAESPEAKAAIWPLLADSMASVCRPSARDLTLPGVTGAVSSVTGQFWTDDEFPLSKYRKSELLDVDYLSAGYPL